MAVNPKTILSYFEKETLVELNSRAEKMMKSQRGSPKRTKQALSKCIIEDVEERGAKQFLGFLKKGELEELCLAIDGLELEKNGNNPKSKRVITKRLQEAMTEGGIEKFFANLPEETLETICEAMGFEASVQVAVSEVHAYGFEAFFSNFTVPELRNLVEEAGLEAQSSSKTILQRCLIYGDNYHVSPKKTKKVVYTKKRPKIARGVSPENLRYHYSVPELHAFMEKNGLRKDGKKTVLIKRILAWLDGDKENTMADANTGKKRRGGRKSAASKKRSPPKRAKREVKPVVEEEVEEEDEDMELVSEEEEEEEIESGEAEDEEVDEEEESEDEESEEAEDDEEQVAIEIDGKKVAILGRFDGMKLSNITSQLEEEGATVSRKVTEDTYLVIKGDKKVKSSELKKAEKLNIIVVDSDFLGAEESDEEEE